MPPPDDYTFLFPKDETNVFDRPKEKPAPADVPSSYPADTLPIHRAQVVEEKPDITTGKQSYDLAELPDPVVRVQPTKAWYDKLDEPRPDKQPQVSNSSWLVQPARFGETLSKGVGQGFSSTVFDAARGALLATDIVTGPSRRAEGTVLPSLRTISDTKDPNERNAAFQRLHDAIPIIIEDQRMRETAHRLVEDVRSDPTFLPMAEQELDRYMVDTPIYKALTDGKAYVNDLLKVDPQWEGGATQLVGQGLGSVIAFYGANMIGGGFFGSAVSITSAQAQAFDQAWAQTHDRETAMEAAVVAVIPGVTDMLPIEVLIHNPVMRKGMIGVLQKAVVNGVTEGTQELAQQLMFNYIAKELYKPEQELTAELKSNFAVGTAVGMITSTIHSALARRRQMFPPEIIEQLDQGTAPPFEQILDGTVGPKGERGPADPKKGVAGPPPKPGQAKKAPPRAAIGTPKGAAPGADAAPVLTEKPEIETTPGRNQLNLPDLDLPVVEGWPLQEGGE